MEAPSRARPVPDVATEAMKLHVGRAWLSRKTIHSLRYAPRLMDQVRLIWTPFGEADGATRAAFFRAGLQLGALAAVPIAPRWHCGRCGNKIPLARLGVTYEVPSPIPVCPVPGCDGHGWGAIGPVEEYDCSLLTDGDLNHVLLDGAERTLCGIDRLNLAVVASEDPALSRAICADCTP